MGTACAHKGVPFLFLPEKGQSFTLMIHGHQDHVTQQRKDYPILSMCFLETKKKLSAKLSLTLYEYQA
jgi:hypothetical protein